MRHLFLIAGLVACGGGGGPGDLPFVEPSSDFDGDGLVPPEDCDDFSAAVQPGMTELCNNGLDDDCNGAADCEDSACAGSPLCVIPEDCDDGIDNDSNGATDCADGACLYATACLDCDPRITLECGDSVSTTIDSGSNTMTGYSCGASSATGVELVYAFTAGTAGRVRFTADPEDSFLGIGGLDVSTYLLSGTCRVDQCVSAVDGGALGTAENMEVDLAAGQTVYFVVEKKSGLGASVDISVTCL